MCFKPPKVPEAKKPDPVPMPLDPAVVSARQRSISKTRSLQGHLSTVLTGPLGTLGEPNVSSGNLGGGRGS